MIPTGGLSVFIHLIVNLYAKAAGVFPVLRVPFRNVPIPASFIGLVLTIVMVYFAGSLLFSALGDDNNYDHFSFIKNWCQEMQPAVEPQNVVIRVDDIQAFAWGTTSRMIIEDAAERDIPLSLGVIPINLRDDFTFYEFLRAHRCTLEFALHGWDNQEPEPGIGEFAYLSREEAAARLEKGVAVIDRLSRKDIVTFIPPLNMLSEGTYEALTQYDIDIITSEGDGEYDFDVTTFDFIEDVPVPATEVVAGCERVFTEGESLCVVMVHPQDFVTDNVHDPEKYQTYLDTLDGLRAQGYAFIRFQDTIVH